MGSVKDERRAFDGSVARERAETEIAIMLFDVVQRRDFVDVNNFLWRSQAHIHERNQALPASQKSCVASELFQQRQRLIETLRSVIVKPRGLHGKYKSSILI